MIKLQQTPCPDPTQTSKVDKDGVTVEPGYLSVNCRGTVGVKEASSPCGHCPEVLECTLPLGTLSPSLQRTVPGCSREPFGKLSDEWGHVSDVTRARCPWECMCKDIAGGGVVWGSGQPLPVLLWPLLLVHGCRVRIWPGPRRPELGHVWVSHVIPDMVLQLTTLARLRGA